MSPLLRSLCIKIALLLATNWVARQERRILREGVELSTEEKQWAQQVGVERVDDIRILYLAKVPMPFSPLLNFFSKLFRSPTGAIGMAAQYGIYMDNNCRNDPSLLVHEMVHVAQYERLGGIRGFLEQYLEECLRDGYWDAAMEDEAREAAIPFNRPPEA